MSHCFRLTSKRKSTGDGGVAAKAQSTVDETFAHKKRRRALKQMQEMAADKEKGSAEQDNNVAATAQKTMVLPKKRPLAGQPANAAAAAAAAAAAPKKPAKPSGDEAVDDETLIRETEAALKSLSGGWPGPRHSFYRNGLDDDRYESPAFVNLFDEKKNSSHSASATGPAAKVDENKNTCNSAATAKQQHDSAALQQQHVLNKTDKDCDVGGGGGSMHNNNNNNSNNNNNNNKKPDKYAPSKYEPDFNELVDDSSDELEIDMSAESGGAGDKDDEDVHSAGERLSRRCKMDVDRRNNNSQMRADEMKSESDSYDSYLMDKTAFSAFRPVSGPEQSSCKDPRLDLPTAVGAAMSPLGPYPPAGATFVVGYAGATVGGGLPSSAGSPSKMSPTNAATMVAVKPVCVKLEDDCGGAADKLADNMAGGSSGPGKMDAHSPLSKQYTILQPAGADSRAASALQDVAREGVLGASVVSSAGSLSPRTAAGTPKLADNGLMCLNNKGKIFFPREIPGSIAK